MNFKDQSDILDSPGIYGLSSNKDVVVELLEDEREVHKIYHSAFSIEDDSERNKFMQDYMANLGMPDLDFQDYLENRTMTNVDNARKEMGIRFDDLNDWLADNWDRPKGEERWDRLREILLGE